MFGFRRSGHNYMLVLFDSFTDELWRDLQPLLKMDPLLSRVIVKKSSVDILFSLVNKVSFSILLMRLAHEDLQQIKVCHVIIISIVVFLQ